MLKESIQDISSFGGTPVYFATVGVFLITNKLPQFWLLTFTFVIAYLVTMAIRFTWWEERPDHEKYKNIWEKFDSGSFPSLHAMRATMLALVLIFFFNTVLATVVLVAGIAAVAYARIWLKRHHPRDVVVGIVLGIVIYYITANFIMPVFSAL